MMKNTGSMVLVLILLGIAGLVWGCESDGQDRAKEPQQEAPVPDENRTISVELTVPSPAWSVSIEKIWIVQDEVWVLARAKRKEGVMAAQVITTVRDSVPVSAPPGPKKVFVYGKTWKWDSDENSSLTFIRAPENLENKTGGARQIYP
jgi:hypothetical protein